MPFKDTLKKYKKLFFPILLKPSPEEESSFHWVIVIAFMKEKRLQYHDPSKSCYYRSYLISSCNVSSL